MSGTDTPFSGVTRSSRLRHSAQSESLIPDNWVLVRPCPAPYSIPGIPARRSRNYPLREVFNIVHDPSERGPRTTALLFFEYRAAIRAHNIAQISGGSSMVRRTLGGVFLHDENDKIWTEC